MAGFNLTAQLQLQAPTNTNQVVSNIKKQLSGITANVQVKGDPRSLAQINKQMQNVSKSASASSKSVSNLNRNLSEAARRFSVITVATGTMLALARSIKNAVGEAIAFERELVKISQVTGKSVSQLSSLTDEVTRLSTSLGASSSDLLSISRTLAQAGFEANKTRQALDILAKTSLGATFDSIQDTTEGAIAVLRQFRKEARQAGGDIKFLEQTMDAINSVSKSFAVESGDLITVIRRVGGVFETAGGSVNELISLFTSVRATTRESAETIATGLRTIFTRIQRTDTVDQLAALGIQLRDAQGQFVGAFEAVRRLSQGLGTLDPRDFRFSEIVEELGGFRQVGKVIPLIRQFTIAQDALNVAQSASGSVARDAATAQQSLQVQAAKVTEDFKALMRTLADSTTFRSIAKGALELASAFIRIAEALEPLLPLITSLIGLRIGKALAPGIGAIAGVTRRSEGGRIHKFASGGFVPGTGNRDTVPAMLQPGEFVIKKSSAKKLGAGTLEAMNSNRYAAGGLVVNRTNDSEFAGLFAKPKGPDSSGKLISLPPKQGREGSDVLATIGAPKSFFIGGTDEEAFNSKAQNMLETGINQLVSEIAPASGNKASSTILSDIGSADIAGKIFEGVTRTIIGDFRAGAGSQQGFDVPRGAGKNVLQELGNLFNSGNPMSDIDYDNKLTESLSNRQSLLKKAINDNLMASPINIATFSGPSRRLGTNELIKQTATVANKDSARLRIEELNAAREKVRGMGLDEETETIVIKRLNSDIKRLGTYTDPSKTKTVATKRQKKNAGGKIDSVPALLTPGEFVVKKSAAQSIGYGNLNKMNQTGVQRFAAGGVVQRFANGGRPTGSGLGLSAGAGFGDVGADLDEVMVAFDKVGLKGKNLVEVMAAVQKELEGGASQVEAFDEVFGKITTRSEENKKALEAEAAAKEKASKRGNLAATDVNTYGTAIGDVEQVAMQEAAAGDTTAGNALADMQKKEIQAITRQIKATETGTTTSEALSRARNVVEQKYGKLATKVEEGQASLEALDKAQKERAGRLKKLGGKVAGAGKAVAGAGAKALGNVGRTAQGLQGVSSAAQNFALMGGAALAASIQMSSLSDVTKQAATETIGFATTLASGGAMAIDVLSNLANIGKAAAGANLLEAGASGASTGADVAETGASGAAAAADTVEAGASMAAAGPLIALVAVVGAVVLALKFFASQSKAEADAIAKARKDQLDQLASGEGGGVAAGRAMAGVGEELGLRESADQFNTAAYSAAVAGGATAVGFIAAGAAMGSVVPIAGTLAGALAGAAVGYFLLSGANEDELNARKAQIESIKGSITTLERLGTSAKKFDDAMADLDKIVFPDTDQGRRARISRELEITSNLDTGTFDEEGNNVTLQNEFGKLAALAAKAGKSVSTLSETDFEEGSAEFIAFQVASRNTTKNMELLAKKTNAARSTLQKAAELEITGELGFDELIASGGQLSQAFKASQDAIRQQANATILAAQAEQEAAEKIMASADSDNDARRNASDAHQKAVKAENDARARMKAQLKAEEDSLKMTTQAAQERFEADKRAAAAAEALRIQLLQTTNFLQGLNEIEANQQERAASLSNRAAIISGGDMDFTRTGPRGLGGDITMIKDLNAFTEEMMVAIGDLPPALRGEAKKQLAIVTDASRVFSEGRDNVLKSFGTPPKGNFGEQQQKAIIKAAGLDPEKMDKDILNKILKDIEEKGKDGIDAADFEEIFGPIKEGGEAAQEGLQKINELRNNEIANYASYLDNVKAKRDADLALLQNVLKANDKARDLVAQARGTEVSAGAREASRRAAAQLNLEGTGIRAGDAAGAARALRNANLQRQAIEREIQNRKASGRSILDLMEKDKKLQETAAKAAKELERLADQSDRASDMIAQIEEERSKREVLTGIVTDFVVGGQNDRQAMINAMNGIRNAAATGTLQNQTPEQRAATVGLLDRLENVILPGMGGLTGGQLKQELVFRDAIRMGLDPEIAKQLATATTKEEQLIRAVEQLTEQMKFAARMQAAAQMASGGLVQYRAGGGSIFQPKGTDTVPAMLTPGEFVIRKSAVDKIGASNLAALNRGGFVQYRQAGGPINALNAGFQGGAVNFPSGDAIRAMFADAVRANPGMFLNRLRSSGIDKDGQIARKIRLLISNNAFNPDRLTFADTLAAQMDRFVESSDIFSQADANGVAIKPLPGRKYSGQRIPLGEARAILPSIVDYMNKLGRVATQGADVGGKGDNKFSKEDVLASNMINEAFGISPAGRAQFLQLSSRQRYSRLAFLPPTLTGLINRAKNNNEGFVDFPSLVKRIQTGKRDDGTATFGNVNVGGAQRLVNRRNMDRLAAGEYAQRTDEDKQRRGRPNARQRAVMDAIEFLTKKNILRMATGGGVPGTDTVPAMLTPGEFVMSKAAVARHGVGYMKSLNRGRIPGFNRGGVVGRGNVQYKQNGGSIADSNAVLSIDPGPLQNVLQAFNTNFSLTLDKITGPLQAMTSSLTDIATAFERLEMYHEFAGDISMSVNISNKDAIIAAVTAGIIPTIEQLIIGAVDQGFADRSFQVTP